MNAILLANGQPSESGNPIGNLVFFGAIFAAMYFLLLRPQRRRLKESQVLQKSIAVGDEVVLNSGIYGFVSAVEDDILWVDIADGHGSERIEVRVSRGSIARKVVAAAASDDNNN